MDEQLIMPDGGIQSVLPRLNDLQIVFLDFDGAETSYFNRDLNISIDNVVVENSGFDPEDIAAVVNALNAQFDDVVFTAERPETDTYSTIYVGFTTAFDEYGSFLGLAETIDAGNQIRNDNAFVLLNSNILPVFAVSVIAHETEHIVHGNSHQGSGLEQFAMLAFDENDIP